MLTTVAKNEPGIQQSGTNSVKLGGSQSNRPLPIKRGHRQVDCRIRIYNQENHQDTKNNDYSAMECLAAKFSDQTVRGRDWLADMLHSSNDKMWERRFEFFMVRSKETQEWTALSNDHRSRLNACLSTLRSAALVVRRMNKRWEEIHKNQQLQAMQAKETALEMFQTHVEKKVMLLQLHCDNNKHSPNKNEAEYTALVNAAAASFLDGKKWIDAANNQAERVRMPSEQVDAIKKLERLQRDFVCLGDALNVNTRELPYAWTVNNEWMVDDWRSEIVVVVCPMCKRKVIESELVTHSNDWTECTDHGLATQEQIAAHSGDETGVSIGGTAVVCGITGATIDNESKDLHDPEHAIPLSVCPTRKKRVRGLSSNVCRFPWAHELLCRFSSCLDANNVLHQAWLQQLNPPEQANDVWCFDKQGLHWLFDYVKYAGGPPFVRTQGRTNTPASLIVRACDAFAERPCLGVPDGNGTTTINRPLLSRATPYSVLVDAAGMKLYHCNGNKEEKQTDTLLHEEKHNKNTTHSTMHATTNFGWLKYGDLGTLVDIVARGLLALHIPIGSHIGVAGYNDIEFCVADLAIARAGMVSVGIHGTYTNDQIVHALHISDCVALLYMSDLEHKSIKRSSQGLWCVNALVKAKQVQKDALPLLHHFVCMDAPCSTTAAATSSFIDWATAATPQHKQKVSLPDPFDARGSPFRSGDDGSGLATTATTPGNNQPSANLPNQDVTTVLFTSGSSGPPKAVAVGVDAFVEDISGNISDAYAATSGVTISYIPLSHSSDRYKVWQHIVFGGRVAFVPFDAEQWDWREKDKESLPGTSPVEVLFSMVASVRPMSMSMPPNIWSGLHGMYRTQLHIHDNNRTKALNGLAALTMGVPSRMKGMATGGAPTPKKDLEFAALFCQHIGASLVDSYGTTEAGALTSNGRQLSDKFKEVEIQLIDVFSHVTTAGEHVEVGQIVVQTPTLALGYMGDPQKTRESFLNVTNQNNSLGLRCGRWYKTGDLGHYDGTGRLILVGRASNRMKMDRGDCIAGSSSTGSSSSSSGASSSSSTLFMPMQYEVDLLSEWSGKVLHVVLMMVNGNEGNELVFIVHVSVLPTESELTTMCTSSLVVQGLRKDVGSRVGVDFHFTTKSWSVSNGLMTGSQKVATSKVRQYYLKELQVQETLPGIFK